MATTLIIRLYFLIYTTCLLLLLSQNDKYLCSGFRPRHFNLSTVATHWTSAGATWYGSPDGAGSTGGSCGYGDNVALAPFSSMITGIGPSLYNSGKECGACYQVKCTKHPSCSGKPARVVITDFCPGCTTERAHFDLSGTAFGAMAIPGQEKHLRDAGILQIRFAREMATPKERVSAKWTDANDLIYIDLCLIEIGKGNRPGTSLSKEGWKNVVKDLNTRTGCKLDQKQLKNRWDLMKKEWSLYKNLMRGCTGIRWDPVRKTVDASDEWWEEQIMVNKAYKKFRNRDLTIVALKYDEVFRDTVATGMGARASTQRSAVGVSIDGENLSFPYCECDADIQAEGSGDSYEICTAEIPSQPKDSIFPPSPVFENGSSSGSKHKRANASSIKEGIKSLLNIAISKSTKTSAYVAPPPGPTVEQCMAVLNTLDGVGMYSGLYYFSVSLFYKSDNRQIFMSHIDDRARVGWLGFKFAEYERGQHLVYCT